MADAIGLAALVLAALLSRWIFPHDLQDPLLWAIGIAVLAGSALHFWHKDDDFRKYVSEPSDCVGLATVSVFLGGVSFLVDAAIGSSFGSPHSLIEAAEHAGSPFGFPLTLFLCPGLTLLAISSYMRNLFLRQIP